MKTQHSWCFNVPCLFGFLFGFRSAVIPMRMLLFSLWILWGSCPWNFWRRASWPISDSRRISSGRLSTSWKRTGERFNLHCDESQISLNNKGQTFFKYRKCQLNNQTNCDKLHGLTYKCISLALGRVRDARFVLNVVVVSLRRMYCF